MKKKILIIGNTPSAYSLAKKMSEKHDIFLAPGCDTLKNIINCVDIREDNITELLDFAMENEIDMTIPVSSKSIDMDIATIFSNNKQPIFAPCANAAMIANDKAKAKKILYKLHIPTPKFGIFDKQNMAVDYLKNQHSPFVIKTNENNSAIVINSMQTAKVILDRIFADKNNRVIIEDYIYGTPFSFYAITDGYKALPFGSSIIYKHSLEGDGGQLTSGMGSCSPNYKLSLDHEYYIMDRIIYPTLNYLEQENAVYMGILGVNGIIADDGKIFILGWQTFTQDTDTASILEIVDDDLYELFESCIIGSFSDEINYINQKDLSSVSLVIKNNNKDNQNNVISGLDSLDDSTNTIFYPSIKINKYLEYEAEYGNTLILTTTSANIGNAANKIYSEAKSIKFNGMYYRKDICKVLY